MVIEHSERVLKAISEGARRPSEIGKKTCLGPNEVKAALRLLRKKKLAKKEDGKYFTQEESNGQK